MPKESILVVEDEADILELVRYNLVREGYRVRGVLSGEEALEAVNAQMPDLIVLDLMLPGIDGLEICKALKNDVRKAHIPIIMLTAKGEEVDMVTGLELGADDYVTKPFNPRELVARVKTILRRYNSGFAPDKVLELGKLKIDLSRHEASIDGKLVSLRTKEFALLSALAQNPGIVLSRERLLELVWGCDYYGETRTVDVHIRWLREKIEPDPSNLTRIITVRGTGYRFEG